MNENLRRREDGLTLVEVMVSLVIFSIAISLAFSAVILVMQKSHEAQQTAAAQAELRLALAQIDRQVRSGNVLFSPANEPALMASCEAMGTHAGTCMRIYTQSNGENKCVQWQMLADDPSAPLAERRYELRTRSWESTWSIGGSLTDWGVVARDLVIGTDAPFVLEGATTPYNERMLRVHLEAWDSRRDAPVAVDSSITGRNTSYGYDAGQCEPVPPG